MATNIYLFSFVPMVKEWLYLIPMGWRSMAWPRLTYFFRNFCSMRVSHWHLSPFFSICLGIHSHARQEVSLCQGLVFYGFSSLCVLHISPHGSLFRHILIFLCWGVEGKVLLRIVDIVLNLWVYTMPFLFVSFMHHFHILT